MWFKPKPSRVSIYPRALDMLPRVASVEALFQRDTDALFLPDYSADKVRPFRGWNDPFGTPYLMVLRNAVFYPRHALDQVTPVPRSSVIRGLGWGNLGLLLSQEAAVYPDSLGKSYQVQSSIDMVEPETRWEVDLPPVAKTLTGTHLFAEFFYAHFGHCLTDMPSRLWPINEGLVPLARIDSILGTGQLGAGRKPSQLPSYAAELLTSLGAPPDRCTFVNQPFQIERLIVPRRLAPFAALMHPAFSRMMRAAGDKLAAQAPVQDRPRKLFLSRSRLRNDPRLGDGMDLLDALFEKRGFAVVHPQELPLSEQAALMQGATHIAGSVGSQGHLCSFCRTDGVKLLTIGPAYFKLDINQKLIGDLGGEETHFLLDIPRPQGPRHRGRWDFPESEAPRLNEVLDGWI